VIAAIIDLFTRRYRGLTRGQRAALWIASVVFGARVAYAIELTGLTRTGSGLDLRAPWSLVFAAMAFVVGLFVVTAPESAPTKAEDPRPTQMLAYVAVPFAVFCAYLLAFYPALMTEDSYREWDQVVSGHFNAILPLAYTLLSWVAAGLWMSPAAPVLMQVVALSVAFGASMVTLRRAGAPRNLVWGLTAGFALLPLNGAMAVSMWKDIAFSAALLWLTAIVFRICASQGRAAGERRIVLELAAALALVALLRPNGPAPALVTAVVLLACYPKTWRPLLAASAGAVSLMLFVNVGLARASHESFEGLGVYNASPFIYDIGAILHSDIGTHRKKPKKSHAHADDDDDDEDVELYWVNEAVTPDERAALAQFDDATEWALLYQPQLYPYWHTKHDHWSRLDDPKKRDEFMRLWFALARRNPGTLLHHRMLTARIGWLMAADSYTASIYAHRVLPDRLGQVFEPPFPWLTRSVRHLLWATVDDGSLRPFIAHPAFASYLAFLFFALTAVRRRSARFLAVAAPLASNWAATMAFCMAQDARYFYSAFVVLPFALGLPWTTARGEPTPSSEQA
jgi:hypothetical protein